MSRPEGLRYTEMKGAIGRPEGRERIYWSVKGKVRRSIPQARNEPVNTM